MKPLSMIVAGVFLFNSMCFSQEFPRYKHRIGNDDTMHHYRLLALEKQFKTASNFLDAAISSANALNSLVKKDNYRNKISSFNNPTSSDLGFNLEFQIHSALKPLLAKAKNVNSNKFSSVVTSLINNPAKSLLPRSAVTVTYNSLVSLVGGLATQEKKITKEDLDSFMYVTGKYFGQFEKLNQANISFDQKIEKLDVKLLELQIDIKDYLLDLITALDGSQQRSSLKNRSLEELLLKYLDENSIQNKLNNTGLNPNNALKYFPSDGIKTAKEIASSLQKLFSEYQKIYAENYNEIKAILNESKSLSRDINLKQVDMSLKELEILYTESRSADALNLRINTLNERLRTLIQTESLKK